ncbi:hypothetical protein JTB14_029201 [Gonioctena quinquepunctata]|nr:hypothetical protein JTB14_029201 [Gonioctena quinquepunctata]
MMDKGEGADFQGKTFEEIDVHLDSLTEEDCAEMNSDIESDNVEKFQTAECLENQYQHSSSESNTGTGRNEKKKENKMETKLRESWSNKKKSLMKGFSKKHICK